MKISWLVLAVVLVPMLTWSSDVLSVPCAEYEINPGIALGFDYGQILRYHAIASQDEFLFVSAINGSGGSFPLLMRFEMHSDIFHRPELRGIMGIPTSSSRIIPLDGYVIMAMGALGLGVVDISDPDFLSPVTMTPTDDVCKDMALLESGHIVTSEWSSLKIYDLQNPLAPVEISAVPLTQARTVAVTEDHAYLPCGNLGLAVVNIANPSAPFFVTQLFVGGHVSQVGAVGNRVYLTGYSVGMITVDVSNPSSPLVIDTLPLEGEPDGLAIGGGYAYVLVDEALTIVPELPDFDAMALVRLNPTATPSLVDYFFPQPDYGTIALGEDRVFIGEDQATADLVVANLQCPDVSDVPDVAVTNFHLSEPWPNPFNPRVNVLFELPPGVPGQLAVFDLRGNLVTEIWRGIGTGEEVGAVWNGTDRTGRACPSGTYGFILTDQAGRHSARVTGTLLR